MDLHEVKALLQAHFSDGCVVIVGSGLSCAEGLPGMGELAQHLSKVIGPALHADDLTLWDSIKAAIPSDGLEAALLRFPPSPLLESAISQSTAELLIEREKIAISEVFSGERVLRLSSLLPFLVKQPSGLPIVTTNYDRLVEIAVEEIGLGVDNMFVGRYFGRLNERESRLSFCRDYVFKGNRNVQFQYAPRALVYKPHGSLDWYLRDGVPVYHPCDLKGAARLIITPGHNKFRNGYNSPFDVQRAKANEAIDRASRLLILGYGFNDDHLETHLSPAIRAGKPSLVITKDLSSKAESIALACKNVIGIDHKTDNGSSGTRVIANQVEMFFPDLSLWDLGSFVSEILEP